MLSSWNDSKNKRALTRFVERVATQGSPDFVPMAERIAVFDNDGTLWTEQPSVIEGFFTMDRINEMAIHDPAVRETQPFKAFLERDMQMIHTLGKRGLMEFVFKAHEAGTPEEFKKIAADWFSSARHPHFKQ